MRTLRKSCLISHLKGALELVGSTNSFFFFFQYLFIYLVTLGLSFGMQTLSCSMWDLVP